jgi:VanZ family protein
VVLGFALLSPLAFRGDPGFLADRIRELASPGAPTPGDMVDAVRNVVLFAGWGLLEVTTDRGRSTRRRVIRAAAGGAAIGLTAEVVQIALPERVPSLLDAAMNAAGAGVGAWATDASLRALRGWRGRPTALGVPSAVLAAPYTLAVALEAAFPLLRHEGPPGAYGGPLERTRWALENVRWESLAVVPLMDVALFLPAGVLLAAAFREAGRGAAGSLRRAAAVGAAVAVAGELAHAPLGRPIEVGPVLVHAGAVAGGAWIAAQGFPGWLRRRRGGARTRDVGWGYLLVLAVWRLRPFVPELDPGTLADELSRARWSPLSALGARRDLYAVSDVLRSFLLFVPVGALVAAAGRTAAGRRPPSTLRAVSLVLGVALAAEAGQIVVAARFFDGTDALVTAAGGLVAWAALRRSAPPL